MNLKNINLNGNNIVAINLNKELFFLKIVKIEFQRKNHCFFPKLVMIVQKK
jgi:hypothetical protein